MDCGRLLRAFPSALIAHIRATTALLVSVSTGKSSKHFSSYRNTLCNETTDSRSASIQVLCRLESRMVSQSVFGKNMLSCVNTLRVRNHTQYQRDSFSLDTGTTFLIFCPSPVPVLHVQHPGLSVTNACTLRNHSIRFRA